MTKPKAPGSASLQGIPEFKEGKVPATPSTTLKMQRCLPVIFGRELAREVPLWVEKGRARLVRAGNLHLPSLQSLPACGWSATRGRVTGTFGLLRLEVRKMKIGHGRPWWHGIVLL